MTGSTLLRGQEDFGAAPGEDGGANRLLAGALGFFADLVGQVIVETHLIHDMKLRFQHLSAASITNNVFYCFPCSPHPPANNSLSSRASSKV